MARVNLSYKSWGRIIRDSAVVRRPFVYRQNKFGDGYYVFYTGGKGRQLIGEMRKKRGGWTFVGFRRRLFGFQSDPRDVAVRNYIAFRRYRAGVDKRMAA